MTYDRIKSVLVLLALLVALGIFLRYAYQLLWVNLRRGQPSARFGQWGERIKGLFVFVGAQFRLFRFVVPGTAHFFIFWGFIFLSLTILQAIVEGLMAFRNATYVIPIIGTFGPLAFFQDLFALCVMIGVSFGLYLRIIVNPERYKGSHKKQGIKVLLFIFTIMLTLLITNAIRINLNEDPLSTWRPISTVLGGLFTGLNHSVQTLIEEIAYWIHLGVVLMFLTELPQGKHFHIVTSIPAVLLRNLEPRGTLLKPAEVDGSVGAGKVEDFR